jgi:purine-binding chemotaxis protein CheW
VFVNRLSTASQHRGPKHLSAIIHEPRCYTRDGEEVWLLCRAGTSLCALPLGYVVEIMRMLPIEPVAGAPLCVRGLSIIRGTPTPVVDTALLCGGRTAPSHRLVTVRAGTQIVALAVDTVLGVRSIKADEPLPPLLQEAANNVVSAIGRLDAELLLFLATARVVSEELLEPLDDNETIA